MAEHHQIWRDRALILGPYFGLVLSEEDYKREMDGMGVAHPGPWIGNDHSSATAHTFTNSSGKLCVLVAMRDWQDCTPIEVAALLVHEAVHAFQQYCEWIGESNPSSEFEAHCIQWISQELMNSFVEQTTPKD